jgi:hypothetical protein
VPEPEPTPPGLPARPVPDDRSTSMGAATLLGLAPAAPLLGGLLALHESVRGSGAVDAGEPLPATAYRLGAVAPLVVLGIVPALLGTLMGWARVAAFGWLLVVGAAGDLSVLWLLRGVRPTALVVDHPTRAGCLVYQPPAG